MSPAQISAVLDSSLPAVFIALNPKGVRELANRAGRPYAAFVDKTMAAFNDHRANNADAPLREFSFHHAGRQITLMFARVRGFGGGDTPKTRALAVSIESALADAPDRQLKEYLDGLRAAVVERGNDADAVLQELTGTTLKWSADL